MSRENISLLSTGLSWIERKEDNSAKCLTHGLQNSPSNLTSLSTFSNSPKDLVLSW